MLRNITLLFFLLTSTTCFAQSDVADAEAIAGGLIECSGAYRAAGIILKNDTPNVATSIDGQANGAILASAMMLESGKVFESYKSAAEYASAQSEKHKTKWLGKHEIALVGRGDEIEQFFEELGAEIKNCTETYETVQADIVNGAKKVIYSQP